MRRQIKHYKTHKNKRSRAVKGNIAVHPFVQASILAAILVVLVVIILLWVRRFFV